MSLSDLHSLRRIALTWLCLAATAVVTAAPDSAAAEGRLAKLVEREQQLLAELRRREDAGEQAVRDTEGRAQRLAAEFEVQLRDFPAHAPSRLAYAHFLMRAGHAREAAAFYFEALKLDPKLPAANQGLANYYAASGSPARALPLYLQAIAAAPSEAAYHYDLGSALMANRDQLVAEKILTREQLEKDALAAFQTAARMKPSDLDLAFRAAETFADLTPPRWRDSLEAWKALELRVPATSIRHDAVLLHMARALIELGRREEARTLLSEVRPDSPLQNNRAALEARLN